MCTKFAAIAVVTLFISCHVSVLAAPAVPDLDSPDIEEEHQIRKRSPQENVPAVSIAEEGDEEEYYEDEEEEEGEEGQDSKSDTETVARIRVVWSGNEDDLYVDNHLQTARMWGIIPGEEGEDCISISEDDNPTPTTEQSTMFITFAQSPDGGDAMTPNDMAPPTPSEMNNGMLLNDLARAQAMQHMYSLFYLGGASPQDIDSMRSFGGAKELIKSALFGSYSYNEATSEEPSSVMPPVAEEITREGQPKKLWAMGAIDMEPKTTPDYNRLVLMRAFTNIFE